MANIRLRAGLTFTLSGAFLKWFKNADDTNEKSKTNSVRNLNRQRPKEEILDWDNFFMGTAFLAGMRSKDPVTQVGACIVNGDRKIVATGYNGMPNGCKDEDFSWEKETDDVLKNKSTYVCHAELNAVLNTNNADIKNCTIYVGLFPCNECAKVIIQAGIKKVIYYSDKQNHKPSNIAAKKMFDAAGVKYEKFVCRLAKEEIIIEFSKINWSAKKPVD